MYVNKIPKIYFHSWKKNTFIILVIICVIVFYQKDLGPPDSCHYLEEGDSLPPAEDEMFFSQDNAIFFHETSCHGGLNPRQACAVESAARNHPNRQINVLFNAPVSENTLKKNCHKTLLELENVRFARVRMAKYAKGTPLEAMVASRPFSKSLWWMQHTSDILRYLTLYKYGGIYLDTDMYVVKDLTPLGNNWIAKEDNYTVNGAAVAISLDPVGRKLINAIINIVNKTYYPDDFTYNGPHAFFRALQQLCKTDNTSAWTRQTCHGLDVYDWEYIYPVHYSQSRDYFRPGKLWDNVTLAYTHHLWNTKTNNLIVQHNSPFAKMAQTFCPIIFKMYSNEFGYQEGSALT